VQATLRRGGSRAVARRFTPARRGVQSRAGPRARVQGQKPRVALAGSLAALGVASGLVLGAPLEARAQAQERPADMVDVKPKFEAFVLELQDNICDAISQLDGHSFHEDKWDRPDNNGGGRSRVLQDGKVFEKAGVNVSIVKGRLPPAAVKQMRSRGKDLSATGQDPPFYAAGISLVIHPHNPMAPTVHLNYRYFEVTDPDSGKVTWWFGGGSDLTPSYLFEDDCIEFHSSLKEACDKHDDSYFPRFKKWCDEYFYNPHREECRGVGGIFFDDLDTRPAKADKNLDDRQAILAFSRQCLESFIPSYLTIMKRRKDMPFTKEQKEWQQLRRGRYVEFNLVYDRGTKFGLATPKNARIESILVSLPLTARWEYQHQVKPGSEEERIQQVLKTPRDWAVDTSKLKDVSFSAIMQELARRASGSAAK